MASEWATSGGLDLHLDLHLDLDGGEGRRGAIVASLQRAIRDGRLPPGARLPSSRTLATDLGVARGTVADAYDQLVIEGWLAARRGSGTWCNRRASGHETGAAGLSQGRAARGR